MVGLKLNHVSKRGPRLLPLQPRTYINLWYQCHVKQFLLSMYLPCYVPSMTILKAYKGFVLDLWIGLEYRHIKSMFIDNNFQFCLTATTATNHLEAMPENSCWMSWILRRTFFKEIVLIATTKPSFNITSGYLWEFLQMPCNPTMKSLLAWLLVVVLGSASGGHVPGTALNGTLNLAFLFPAMGSVGTMPGISVAVKEIQRRELLPSYTIEWQLWESGCNPYTGKTLFEFNDGKFKTEFFLVSSCNCLWPIHWSYVLSGDWRCSWSSADRWCSIYIR